MVSKFQIGSRVSVVRSDRRFGGRKGTVTSTIQVGSSLRYVVALDGLCQSHVGSLWTDKIEYPGGLLRSGK